MIRTQISLTDEQKRRLDAEAARTGLSMSELIRRLLDEHYETDTTDERRVAWLAAVRRAKGAWRDRDFDGEEYVERLRTGRRLSELYG